MTIKWTVKRISIPAYPSDKPFSIPHGWEPFTYFDGGVWMRRQDSDDDEQDAMSKFIIREGVWAKEDQDTIAIIIHEVSSRAVSSTQEDVILHVADAFARYFEGIDPAFNRASFIRTCRRKPQPSQDNY